MSIRNEQLYIISIDYELELLNAAGTDVNSQTDHTKFIFRRKKLKQFTYTFSFVKKKVHINIK